MLRNSKEKLNNELDTHHRKEKQKKTYVMRARRLVSQCFCQT